ncbi:MAG: M48 family metallopeptidase [Zoogloeaceae bacterium]|jgi:Zn-dependent protease with chaperone function|nr:M48 family metallopeptidase [Zoogloeaceae bacterium]
MEARYFDGKTSRCHPVRLRAVPEGIEVAGIDWNRREPLARIRVSEPIGAAPRTLTFADGSYCEVAQGRELNALLTALGHRDRAVARWQKSWRLALGGVVFMATVLLAAYRWGLPWVAERTAPMIPPEAVTYLSQQVLKTVDGRILEPSALPLERQQTLTEGMRRIADSDPALTNGRLLFRSAPKVGPNAFALPDGQIVLFDELVALADNDEEVLGVLAHELAHVKFRHGLRQAIQSSVVGAVVASYFGDISVLLSGLTAVLLESKYSRGFEQEADDYGAALMRRNGMSADGLASMLEKMQRAHDKESPDSQSHADWLSSHPETAARIKHLRATR